MKTGWSTRSGFSAAGKNPLWYFAECAETEAGNSSGGLAAYFSMSFVMES